MTDADYKPGLSDLLVLARAAEPGAIARLFEAAYSELCELAEARLRALGGQDGALDTRALVHESFLRLAKRHQLHAADQAHFFKYAGRVMRSVIVDTVREQRAQRRGGGAVHAQLTTQTQPLGARGEEQILHIHEALDGLAAYDSRLNDVVQMRYFVGMTDAEIADVLGITDRTVRRAWERARLLLLRALEA